MSSSEHERPGIAIGRHPDFGIVAASSTDRAVIGWVLRGFDFHPLPDQPGLYVLANQQRNGEDRAARAVDLLRRADYRVTADVEFDANPGAPGPEPVAAPTRISGPEVAFAEHPRLGIVAATSDGSTLGRQLLTDHGWRHHPGLDIYAPPVSTGRNQALGQVARATVAMHRAGLRVAVQPALARDVTAHRSSAPAKRPLQERSSTTAARRFPALNAAALTSSPARASLPGAVPISAPAPSGPPSRPADSRTAFSRTH